MTYMTTADYFEPQTAHLLLTLHEELLTLHEEPEHAQWMNVISCKVSTTYILPIAIGQSLGLGTPQNAWLNTS